MPKKYPGGYAILDLKGMIVSTTPTTITDPDILSVLNAIRDHRLHKPLYLSNFKWGAYDVVPVLMTNASDAADELFASLASDGSILIRITMDDLPDEATIAILD